MDEKELLIQKIRCFYYSVELPVSVLENRQPIYSLPESVSFVCSVAGLNSRFPEDHSDSHEVQYLQSEFSENYLYIKYMDDFEIYVGPFLIESPSSAFISGLIRTGRISLKHKTAIEELYASMPIVSSQKYFYSGKMLEKMLLQKSDLTSKDDIEEYSSQFNESDYYWQTHDYRKQQFLHSPYPTEQEILRAISKGDKETALHILKEINIRPRARLASTVQRSLKNSLIGSCTILSRAAIQGGVNPDTAFTLSDAFIQNIEKTSDTKALLNIEMEMVSQFADAAAKQRSQKYSLSVNRAINYIESHLCDPITVEDIAKFAYLNANYLSGIFLKETGETVHNRILRRRIEESSFFVSTSSATFAEIASFYQFCSQSHFIQCFKQYMHVTPGVYRKESGSNA